MSLYCCSKMSMSKLLICYKAFTCIVFILYFESIFFFIKMPFLSLSQTQKLCYWSNICCSWRLYLITESRANVGFDLIYQLFVIMERHSVTNHRKWSYVYKGMPVACWLSNCICIDSAVSFRLLWIIKIKRNWIMVGSRDGNWRVCY